MTMRASRVLQIEPGNVVFFRAFVTGCERLAAWADLIDRINVFPVADGDTGRNLLLSLAPLRYLGQKDRSAVIRDLLISSRGMSGNIATRFFSEFLRIGDACNLLEAALSAREHAWRAVEDPRPGTILSLFDALCDALAEYQGPQDNSWVEKIVDSLEKAVISTTEQLPVLRVAGVVDAGALGGFLFFEGFFHTLVGNAAGYRMVKEVFGSRIMLSDTYSPDRSHGYCVDVVLEGVGATGETARSLRALGDSVVTHSYGDLLKAHLHTDDRGSLREKVRGLGTVVKMTVDDLSEQTGAFQRGGVRQAIHVVTDAAASVTREDAVREGISLLDSYVNLGEKSIPESCLDPDELYRAMRAGVKVSTSQASVFERHQQYDKLTSLYPRSLYLCVGAVYTGNYHVVQAWKRANGIGSRLNVIDTGLASGKLGLVALETARCATGTGDPNHVLRFAGKALSLCEEYVFLDRLEYLAAGGRMSRTGSFVGDLLHMRPVITPTRKGAQKVSTHRNRGEQLAFLLERVEEALRRRLYLTRFLLEYTDTRSFLEDAVWPRLRELCPEAEFRVRPISNTSGAHFGPGTWGVAFLPAVQEDGAGR